MYRARVVVSAVCPRCAPSVFVMCLFVCCLVCLANLALGRHEPISSPLAQDKAENHRGLKRALPWQQSSEPFCSRRAVLGELQDSGRWVVGLGAVERTLALDRVC